MPNYQNPLDEFRTHSYHFTLSVANQTETLRKMIEMAENGGGSYFQAINSTKLGERIDVNGSDAYLLVDTRRYSQFSITDYSMNHTYGTGPVSNPTVPTSEAKMRLVDTTGLSFINFLMDIMRNKIQSTRASAFFLLTISFHGHSDDNTHTRTVSTCFIPLVLNKLHFEFNNSGSVYDMEFFETEGNPGAGIPQLVDLGDIQAVSTEKTSNTLGGMLQSLEDRLNVRALQFYQKYTNEAYTQMTEEQKSSLVRSGKLVQYMITVPDEWKNFQVNSAGKSANVEQVFLAKAKKTDEKNKEADTAKSNGDEKQVTKESKERASYHSFSYTTDINMSIKIILESCKEYLDLGSEEKIKKGEAIVHRTLTCVTSDANTYMVHFDIYPHKVPKIDEQDKTVKTGQTKKDNKLANGEIKNLIKYDYLFSGKNSHILDLKIDFAPTAAVALDMDLSIGQHRMAENASTGQKQEQVKENGEDKTVGNNPLIRQSEPIFPPLKTKDQQTNFSSMNTEEYKKDEANKLLKAKQEHTNTMAYLHYVGSLHSQMTIRGNPNIIRKYADRNLRGGLPKHPATVASPDTLRALRSNDSKGAEDVFNKNFRSKLISEKAEYIANYVKPRINDELSKTQQGTDPLLHGNDISVGPLYVMVDIFAPNIDFLGNQTSGGMFTNKFFYDGAYMVMSINTEFNNGSFRHVINMIPYPYDDKLVNQQKAIA